MILNTLSKLIDSIIVVSYIYYREGGPFGSESKFLLGFWRLLIFYHFECSSKVTELVPSMKICLPLCTVNYAESALESSVEPRYDMYNKVGQVWMHLMIYLYKEAN